MGALELPSILLCALPLRIPAASLIILSSLIPVLLISLLRHIGACLPSAFRPAAALSAAVLTSLLLFAAILAAEAFPAVISPVGTRSAVASAPKANL